MSTRKPFAIYAITKHGIDIAARLLAGLPGRDLYASEKLHTVAPEGALPLRLPMGPRLVETFDAYDCHVFIISMGAVVRMMAPLLKDKKTDPAVVCVDDDARYAICFLSGPCRARQRLHGSHCGAPGSAGGHHHRIGRARHADRGHPGP